MHPPTALPRSLSEHLNPPPVDPIVRGAQPVARRRAARGGVPRLLAFFRRRPGSRPDPSRALRD